MDAAFRAHKKLIAVHVEGELSDTEIIQNLKSYMVPWKDKKITVFWTLFAKQSVRTLFKKICLVFRIFCARDRMGV